MSDTKLSAIPRAPKQQPGTTLKDWIGGDEPPQAANPNTVTIKATVSPALKRRLRMAAIEQDTTVADILREQAERWLNEQGL